MGALRTEVTRSPTRAKRRKRALPRAVAPKIVRVKPKPKISAATSARVDAALKYMRWKLANAYPGEVPKTQTSNAELRKTGLGHLADLNESLGLTES